MSKKNPADVRALFDAIVKLKSRKDATMFLTDILTESEINEISERWKAARMLSSKVPYVVIVEETGLSSRTVARVKKWLDEGTGGYQLMIKRCPEQYIKPPKGRPKRGPKPGSKRTW
jgi:TrpR-related protein YerC/YecD